MAFNLSPITGEQRRKLVEAILKAHLEECESGGECGCVTMEEHEHNLKRARELRLQQEFNKAVPN